MIYSRSRHGMRFCGFIALLGLAGAEIVSSRAIAQATQDQPPLQWKLSGFENLVAGGASQGQGGAFGGSSESEIELTPQYKTTAGMVFAGRGVFNVEAASDLNGSNSRYDVSLPELSLFAIGDFGRIEVGDRAGFPQTLIGFAPSDISFTAAEFGPESGSRLDPNGGLPTAFLPHPLADRINGLTYLGYAERFYDDRSLKLIYLTPRSTTGFYGAISFTPDTDISSGYNLTGQTHTSATGLQDATSPGTFRTVTQAAVLWTHRGETLDLTTGVTYSYAAGSAGSPVTPTLRDSNSLSGGITATLNDSWTFGLSGTYDGFSNRRGNVTTGHSPVAPFGVVASANYINGPWTLGGYYQHATADSATPQSQRDTVDIGEIGLSRLIDQSHDLLGNSYYTDVKLFASLYYYHFHGTQLSTVDSSQNGEVFLVGARFSFF